MTIVATVPFASIAEADVYFAPGNHLYTDEWWETGSGVKASMITNWLTDDANLKFEALNYGYDGNLLSVVFEDDIWYEPVVIVVGYSVTIGIELGDTTAADVVALCEAESAFTALMTVAPYDSLTGEGLVAEADETFLYGGVDPDSSRSALKGPALAFATRKINGLPFTGTKVSPTQANAFPRQYVAADGTVITQTEVPEAVKMACCEEALAILKYGNTTRYKLQAQGVKGFGFGNMGLRENFRGSRDGDILAGEAFNMLRPYMRRSFTIGR